MGGVLFDVPGCNGGGYADSQVWAVFTGSAGRKTAGAAFRRTGCRASAGRVFGMVGVAGPAARSVGLEDGVEGLAGAHHEVQVRFGEVAEAAMEDDRQHDVVLLPFSMVASRR